MCFRVTREVTVAKNPFVTNKNTVNTTETQIPDWGKVFANVFDQHGIVCR